MEGTIDTDGGSMTYEDGGGGEDDPYFGHRLKPPNLSDLGWGGDTKYGTGNNNGDGYMSPEGRQASFPRGRRHYNSDASYGENNRGSYADEQGDYDEDDNPYFGHRIKPPRHLEYKPNHYGKPTRNMYTGNTDGGIYNNGDDSSFRNRGSEYPYTLTSSDPAERHSKELFDKHARDSRYNVATRGGYFNPFDRGRRVGDSSEPLSRFPSKNTYHQVRDFPEPPSEFRNNNKDYHVRDFPEPPSRLTYPEPPTGLTNKNKIYQARDFPEPPPRLTNNNKEYHRLSIPQPSQREYNERRMPHLRKRNFPQLSIPQPTKNSFYPTEGSLLRGPPREGFRQSHFGGLFPKAGFNSRWFMPDPDPEPVYTNILHTDRLPDLGAHHHRHGQGIQNPHGGLAGNSLYAQLPNHSSHHGRHPRGNVDLGFAPPMLPPYPVGNAPPFHPLLPPRRPHPVLPELTSILASSPAARVGLISPDNLPYGSIDLFPIVFPKPTQSPAPAPAPATTATPAATTVVNTGTTLPSPWGGIDLFLQALHL